MRSVLVDTGPLVALLKRSDDHHKEIVRTLKGIQDPLVSVWPVFVEAMYLLSTSWEAQKALWEILETGKVRLLHLDEADVSGMKNLMEKYGDLPMDSWTLSRHTCGVGQSGHNPYLRRPNVLPVLSGYETGKVPDVRRFN